MSKRIATFIGLLFLLSTVVFCAPATVNVAQASGRHPRVVRAMEELRDAQSLLKQAPPIYGGHKAKAIKRIDEALRQLRLALDYAR